MITRDTKIALSATLLFATQACIAGVGGNARYCIESATIAAGYYLTDTQVQYNEGKDDASLDDSVSSYDGFVKGTHDSSTKRGIVYSKFGKDSSGNYIVTAYLGLGCGPATNTKLFCNLKKAGSNWTDSSSAPPNPVTGFYMDCKLCTGVKLASSGSEAAASAIDQFDVSELTAVANLLNEEIAKVNRYGIILESTSSAWPANSCNTVTA